MNQAVDPIANPSAYQQSLLAALGGDDPAVAQATTPAAFRALVAEAGVLLRVRPEPNEWSVLECIDHLVLQRTIHVSSYLAAVSGAPSSCGVRMVTPMHKRQGSSAQVVPACMSQP